VKGPWPKLLLIVAIVLIGLFLLWFVLGKGTGDECDDNWECFGFGTSCVRVKTPPYRYCTTGCETDSDCPEGMRCTKMPMFNPREVSVRVRKICVL
jgi:hypothetical protein